MRSIRKRSLSDMKCNSVKVNYQKVLEEELKRIKTFQYTPRLLLHACCAPCSSYCLEYLTEHFDITVLYYNPNISIRSEYDYRFDELKRLADLIPKKHNIEIVQGRFEPDVFFEKVKGLEKEPERGKRCTVCFSLRLEESFKYALRHKYDYVSTTLTISPLKDSGLINELGGELSRKYNVPYLFSDFKKKNGYKRSVELSAEYGLYRQNYCGCIFSKNEMTNKEIRADMQQED
ncbi:MAG: epoxyqueuosine reductase QueH [Lachnospiraceae bacterium]